MDIVKLMIRFLLCIVLLLTISILINLTYLGISESESEKDMYVIEMCLENSNKAQVLYTCSIRQLYQSFIRQKSCCFDENTQKWYIFDSDFTVRKATDKEYELVKSNNCAE